MVYANSGAWPSSTDLPLPGPTLVTNADKGVFLSWDYSIGGVCSNQTYYPEGLTQSDCTQEQDLHRLIAISDGAVVSDTFLNTFNAFDSVTPLLQSEDGTIFTNRYSGSDEYIDAIDQSGNVKWSVKGFYPVVATADGGVIGQSPSYQYVTFDQNGVANGMLAQLPTQSWIQNTYELGSVDLAAFVPVSYASSFLAMLGGNNSGNGTPVQQTWYPELPSCHDPSPEYSCPGPKEVAKSALEALKSFVPTCAVNCPDFVFQPLGTVNDAPQFSTWLNKPAIIADMRYSNLPYCDIWGTYVNYLACIIHSHPKTVSDFYSQSGGQTGAAALTVTPSVRIVTFYNPTYQENTCAFLSSSTKGFGQQSLLFHEALHGFYGKDDLTIMHAYQLQVDVIDGVEVPSSENISKYILNVAFLIPGNWLCSK